MRYRTFVDQFATRISVGELPPGTRLPPQREFAYQNGIAYSTAARIYAELTRMGLITGEVGRGTYVRDRRLPSAALAEPRRTPVDLEYNFPMIAAQSSAVAEVLRALDPEAALVPGRIEGSPELRALTADYLERGSWRPHPDQVLFAANGRQAIAAALSALMRPGERMGVEPMTYPVARGIAARMGIQVVPLQMDSQGIDPDGLREAAAAGGIRALYVQPDFQNPMGLLTPVHRRREIAEILNEFQLPAIEDGIYAFLGDLPPIASFAPAQTILIDSLSKRVAPGLGLGYLVASSRFLPSLAQSLRTGPWGPTGLSLEFGRLWLSRNDVRRFDVLKRDDAAARQRLARTILGDFQISGDPRAYHLWLGLPDPWRAEDFAAAAARDGIAVTPAHAFAAGKGHAPAAVRIALSAPPLPMLEEALKRLATLMREGPVDRED